MLKRVALAVAAVAVAGSGLAEMPAAAGGRRDVPVRTDFLTGLKDVDKGWHMTRPNVTLRNLAEDLASDLAAFDDPIAVASFAAKIRFMRTFVDERQDPETARRWRETFTCQLDDGPTNRLWRTPAVRPGKAGYVTAMTCPQKDGPLPQDPDWPTFSITLDVDFTAVKAGERLAEIPGVCEVFFRMADTEKKLAGYDYNWGNYVNNRLPDGRCPVIEALMDVRGGRIGIPLGALKNPSGRKRVLLDSRKGHWTILVDGVKDDEMPGHPEPVVLPGKPEVRRFSPRVTDAAFVRGGLANPFPPVPDEKPIARPIQYWTPDAFNAWVGDVVVDTRRDRLHLFYLYDRRHHGGGGGRGGHYFAHISTTDLVHWVEHPLATEIENWWESHGTGTPFEKDGKYCLAFGHHSTRMVDAPRTTGPVEFDWSMRHKWARRVFTADELVGRIPHGSTYAVSSDGLHFAKTGTIYDTDQNPSIYNLPDGRYLLAADRKLYTSRDFKVFDVYDDKHNARGDCPAYFTWNGRHYLIQGNDFFDSSATGEPGTWEDWSKDGWYVSDGNSVPMVANWKGNRRIVAGWIRHVAGWGGWLCFRELVAEPGGRLGMKWVPEMMPSEKPLVFHAKGDRPFELRFLQTNGGKKKARFSFRIDPKTSRAQFADVQGDGSVPDIPTLADYHKDPTVFSRMPPITDRFNRMAYKPASADVFAQDNVTVAGRDYDVRLILHEDPKSGCTIFDVEIDGRRTMVCRRWGKYRIESP